VALQGVGARIAAVRRREIRTAAGNLLSLALSSQWRRGN
jgi:hypothetical protein